MAQIGYSSGRVRVQKLIWGLFIKTNDFCFLSFALFLLYHVVLSSWWVVVGGGGGWWFPAITCLNPTTVMVVLLLGLWLLLGCDNM